VLARRRHRLYYTEPYYYLPFSISLSVFPIGMISGEYHNASGSLQRTDKTLPARYIAFLTSHVSLVFTFW
jgi:hypothetical protein